jgi:hypothetical protein
MVIVSEMVEDTMRKGTNFVGIEPDRFLGIFSLVLGYIIAGDGTTRFGQWIEAFGIPLELSTFSIALALMVAGVVILISRPRSATAWWMCAAPMFLYMVMTAVAVLRLDQPDSGAVVSIAFVIALFSICDYYLISQRKNEALDHKDAEIARLTAKIAALEARETSGQ